MSIINSLIPSLNREPANGGVGNGSAAPSVRPLYEVKENDEVYALTVHLPGVSKETLSITDENGLLTVRGERNWKQPTGWTSLHRESSEVAFGLSLQHENAIDSEKIRADLVDGVLRLTLPKAEARKPRKIPVS